LKLLLKKHFNSIICNKGFFVFYEHYLFGFFIHLFRNILQLCVLVVVTLGQGGCNMSKDKSKNENKWLLF